MVYPVVAVSTVGKAKQDKEKKRESSYSKSNESQKSLFSNFLEQEIDEQRDASMECRTVTYGQDSRLHTFEYQTREYRY